VELSILKTGALGDVLRTTAILPGLAARHDNLRVTWVTAKGALDLIQAHPLIAQVVTCDPSDLVSVAAVGDQLAETRWEHVISLDDEGPMCALATRLAEASTGSCVDDLGIGGVLSGAYRAADGSLRYTNDVGAWFDMGLLSRFGKAEADRRKIANLRTHPEIYAEMLGIEKGEPELPLPASAQDFARDFSESMELRAHGRLIGMNTGSGGRWESKKLSVDRSVALMECISASEPNGVTFLILGGPEERDRNREILRACARRVRAVDAGTDNGLLEFAALVDQLDLLITSDSLALHVANARRVPIVAFFAPTSASEIDLYGRGICVASTSPDYCSYRRDADTSTLTAERLAAAVLELLRRSL
jgi:heptosyltransferase-2